MHVPSPLRREEFDYRIAPAEVLPWLRVRGGVVFLDSAGGAPDVARYSWLMVDPAFVVEGGVGRTVLRRSAGERKDVAEFTCDPLDFCESVLGAPSVSIEHAAADDLLPPFAGGFCGYAGYDYGAALAGVVPADAAPFKIPPFHFGWYDTVLAWDHILQRAWILAHTARPEWKSLLGAARSLEQGTSCTVDSAPVRTEVNIAEMRRALAACARGDDLLVRRGNAESARGGRKRTSSDADSRELLDPGTNSNFSSASYMKAVEQVREFILAGDIFQANISQRFSAPFRGDPWQLYLRMRESGNAPFSAFIDLGDAQILSASPELFLRVDQKGVVETRPIKGTRRRGETDAEDQRLAAELLRSEKDRSENLMIVDLLRNDLSRGCAPGSVYVSSLCALERLPSVQHLVSSVTGTLADSTTAVMMLRYCLPGGSITGAPKVRAMEIIAEIEGSERGVYCGAIGFLDPRGTAELNIAIRTVVVANQSAFFSAGGGLVLDSTPAAEYDETLAKAAGIMAALSTC